jgi:nucleotide-binding universal stress UspA family protein
MKILVASDGSDAIVRACRFLTELLGQRAAEIRVVTVLSYHLYPGSLVPGEKLPGEREMQEEKHAAIRAATDEPKRILEASGHDIAVGYRFGNPRDEILAEVEDWNPDLLVLGRRRVRGVERWLGSVSEHVVRHVDVAVLVSP